MLTAPLRLKHGSVTIELLTDCEELRMVMSHIYSVFAAENVISPPTSMPDVVNGDGFTASIDGHEYRYDTFFSAVRQLEDAIADELLKGISYNLLLHAATVVDDRHTIIVPGQSGSGKTTTVLELVRRGMHYITDEYTAIDGAVIQPFPRSAARRYQGPVPQGVNLEIPSFTPLNGYSDYLAYMLPDRRVGLQPSPIKQLWLIFLYRIKSGSASVRTISSGEACVELMKSAFSITDHQTASVYWSVLSDVARSARSCVLEYSDAKRDLDLALNHLEQR